MMKWIEPERIATSEEITNAFRSSFLLAEQLSKRGIASLSQAEAYLSPEKYSQSSPLVFPGMGKAVERIRLAIKRKERIGIWGDFDVDGQTSTALLIDSLRKIGAEVCFHIPNRARESHGIQLDFLKEFLQNKIGLMITCDTGISEFQALEYAVGVGLDVIVSDHHTPQEQLPPVFAVINPRLLPGEHPFQNLAGVGTAFQIVRTLYADLGRLEESEQYYDLVALGTIADLVELNYENRFYTQKGLMQMNADLRPALSAILTNADFRNNSITESLIGYTIAPRFNAVGRLEDANQNVDFLLSQDTKFTAEIANNLEDLNNQRKLAVDGVYHSALEMVEKEPELNQFPTLVLAKKGWEKGVVGIAASKLVEDFNKPVILLNIEDDLAAGSARSIEGVNIIQAISENSANLNSFGGHPMAAGLSLKIDQIQAFRFGLAQSIKIIAKTVPAEKQLQIDGYLPLSNLNPTLLAEVNQLAPFGSGNPPPVLVSRNLDMVNQTTLGKNESHRKLLVKDDRGETREVLWWNAGDKRLPQDKFDLAYYLRSNEFRGNTEITLELLDFREQQYEQIEIHMPVYTTDIYDYRTAVNATNIINELSKLPDVCLWGEGVKKEGEILFTNRLQLKKTAKLAILTPPPDLSTLQEALKTVKPRSVYLFRLNQPDDSLQGFLENLSGLIRYSISHLGGKASMKELAAAISKTGELIEMGLTWWQLHGEIKFVKSKNEEYLIQKVEQLSSINQTELQNLNGEIIKYLTEIASFRSFYNRADPAFLLRKV